MEKTDCSAALRFGVICPSDVAFRRFMPALTKVKGACFAGIGVNSIEERFGNIVSDTAAAEAKIEAGRKKAEKFTALYGGKVYESYEEIVNASDIDALYIPLPPALHYKWADKAIKAGKHVLVEKPATICYSDTKNLVEEADRAGLALHEDYMFVFHRQLQEIDHIISSGEIGDIRLFRISFGFPLRSAEDFRYSKDLGGGAVIDACGYTIKYATYLLGNTAEIKYAAINYLSGFDVDMYGSGALVNKDRVTAQIAYGMDNNYKCELEAWGSRGCLSSGRVLTAPADYTPTVTLRKGNEEETRALSKDDAFKQSIEYFIKCIHDKAERQKNYSDILKQAELLDQFRSMAGA